MAAPSLLLRRRLVVRRLARLPLCRRLLRTGGGVAPFSPAAAPPPTAPRQRRAAVLAAPRTTARRPLFSLAAAALGQAPGGGGGGPQNALSTARTLPYAAPDLFRIIADVDAYAQFLPHCTLSRVTHWRKSTAAAEPGAAEAPAWPARADLTVGWGPLSQTYSSRVYCVPRHGVVEAVSGRAGQPTLTAAERAEIGLAGEPEGPSGGSGGGGGDDTFESLVTRWTVAPRDDGGPSPSTRVELHIRFQFRSPLYQLAAAQVGDEMAAKMIEAFEARAEALLGRRPTGRL